MRRKSTTDKELAQAAAQQQSGFKKVRRTEEFIEAVKPDEPLQSVINIPAREVEDDQGDELLDFLAELEEEIGLSLRVDRLPQYSANGKWNKGAAYEFCDNIPINKSDLKTGAYMSTIRDLFGPAAYRCTLREVGAGIIKTWPIKIATPLVHPQQRQATSITYAQQATGEPPPPRDTLQELLDAGEKAAKLKKIFGWDHESVPTSVVTATPVVEREPLQDRIIEAALNAALKTEKPETVAGLLQSYLNPRSDEFSWKEIVAEIAKPAIPLLMSLLNMYAQNQARQQAANVTRNTQGQLSPVQQPAFYVTIQHGETGRTTSIPANQPMPEGWSLVSAEAGNPHAQYQQTTTGYLMPTMEIPHNPPNVGAQPEPQQEEQLTQDEEEEMARDELLYNLADMLEQCVRKAASDPETIAKGKREVLAYKRRFPFMSALLDALYAMPPEAVIGLLASKVPEVAAMINNDVAKQAIRDFQASLREPEEQEQ